MSFLAVAFVYPLLVAVLCAGTGLVVEGLAGLSLPTTLIPACGFAAMLVVSQLAVLSPALAPFTPWILVLLTLGGFVFRRGALRTRWSVRGPRWWLTPLAGLAAYLTVALPLIATGHLTFPGYLLDTTAGFHLSAGEWMLHHGAPLPPPYAAYGAMLHDYYGNGYPSGGQVLLAVTGWLSGQDLLWLYFPFQVCALAVSALVIADLGRRAGLPRPAAAFTGWVAAVPALVCAYAQMGSIKELAALPCLLLMGAIVMHARAHAESGWRGAIPFGMAGGAAVGAIGPAAVVWIALFGIAALLFAVPVRLRRGRIQRFDARSLVRALTAAGSLLVFLVLFSIPTITRLTASLNTALSFSKSNAAAVADPGNLLRPLRWVQAFGVWLGETHRLDPQYLDETYALLGLTIAAFVLGVIWLIRRRNWAMLALLAAALIVWVVLTKRGTEWTDAKVLMLTSPVVMCVALVGAFGDLRGNRVQGILIAAAIGGGVLASDALLYHGTNLAPGARYSELLTIGRRFAGQGPTLVTDFDEYTFYVLRKLNIDGPGFAGDMHGPFLLFGGAPVYAHSYDVDDIEAPFVQRFRLIVMRRSPRWSRPPGNFRLVFNGSYYDVWRRTGLAPVVHVPVGAGMQASGTVACRQIHSVAGRAIKNGQSLRYALRPLNVIADLARAVHSPSVTPIPDLEGFPALTFSGPGEITASVAVRHGATYGLWLGGNIDRTFRVSVDGRLVGEPSHQSGGDGNMIRIASVSLKPGRHTVTVRRVGGSLAPGDQSGNLIDGIYLQAVGPGQETVSTVPSGAWRALCGRELDWLEVV